MTNAQIEEFDGEGPEDGLYERVREEGTLITQHWWDSGGPGAGADEAEIYKWNGGYWVYHDTGMDGYQSLAEAARCNGIVLQPDEMASDTTENDSPSSGGIQARKRPTPRARR